MANTPSTFRTRTSYQTINLRRGLAGGKSGEFYWQRDARKDAEQRSFVRIMFNFLGQCIYIMGILVIFLFSFLISLFASRAETYSECLTVHGIEESLMSDSQQ